MYRDYTGKQDDVEGRETTECFFADNLLCVTAATIRQIVTVSRSEDLD